MAGDYCVDLGCWFFLLTLQVDSMIQEWSKIGKEVVWIGLAFIVGLSPSYMGYPHVTMGCICLLFVYILMQLWNERK
jgi:hypothetical protein